MGILYPILEINPLENSTLKLAMILKLHVMPRKYLVFENLTPNLNPCMIRRPTNQFIPLKIVFQNSLLVFVAAVSAFMLLLFLLLFIVVTSQEDKDQVKRERDRLSSQVETMTQECNDAREAAQSHEHQLQAECEGRMSQCQEKARNLEGELSSCRASAAEANSQVSCVGSLA